MSDYGFRISEDGVDVKTGDDDKMVITSKYPLLKGALSGSGSQSVTSRTDDFTAATSDIITAVSGAHGLENGDILQLTTTGTLPDPLEERTLYYVIDKTATTFKLSETPGGSAIDITDTGIGTHTYTKIVLIEISHNLGYIPFGKAFFENGSGTWWQVPFGADGAFGTLSMVSRADSSKFYLEILYTNSITPTANVLYSYYIYIDKGKI